MKEPKILVNTIKKMFQACCFFMAIYWITYFSSQFLQNGNTTFISMKTFNDGPDDMYPVFTICFKGAKFHWIQDENIFDSYALSPDQYEIMLKGGTVMRDEFNRSLKLYEKKSVNLSDGVDVKFYQFYLKITDFLQKIEYIMEPDLYSVYFPDKRDGNDSLNAESIIDLSYHTPEKICFSDKSEDQRKQNEHDSQLSHDNITKKCIYAK